MTEFTEFTEKLNSSELVSNAWDEIDKDQADAGLLIDTISNEFKEWQPPKPLVVVPQFVADWFDINQDDIDGNIKALTSNIYRNPKSGWSEMDKWFMYNPNKPVETLISMKLYGYTVEKEQLYEIEFYVDKEDDRCLLMKTGKTISFEYESQNEGHYQQQFTEAEIKAIDERYWAFRKEVGI